MKTVEEIKVIMCELETKIQEFEDCLNKNGRFSEIRDLYLKIDKLDSVIIDEIHKMDIDAIDNDSKANDLNYYELHKKAAFSLSKENLINHSIEM